MSDVATTPAQPTRDPWLTEKEAAKELRVSVYTVRAEREAGKLGYARMRTRVFYPMSMINEYKASLLCPTTTSGSTQTTEGGTSLGPTAGDRSVRARALQAAAKHRNSLRRSS